ncbi:hypothetical protein DFJ63DRAFT_153131 [Scheffersomyces coipomensis]|uniref:uncharacterized protein n=1 Tax=Scheffersomyces coipomensis TaxID=1788519 RepID=UPI00315D10BE
MKQQRISSYNDGYILKFFLRLFPKFPYDIMLKILQLLPIPHILILQSISNDDYTKSLKIQQITNQRFLVDYPIFEKRSTSADFITTRKIFEIKQTFRIMAELTRSQKENIIPVKIQFSTKYCFRKVFPVKLLNELLGDSNNFDLALKLPKLAYKEYIKLQRYKKSLNVSSLTIDEVENRRGHFRNIDLDFSNYSNLNSFGLTTLAHIRSLNLNSVLYKLTELEIVDCFDVDYITKFVNLKILSLQFNDTFYVKRLPRNVITLCLKNFSTVCNLIIESSEDWPQNLNSLCMYIYSSNGLEGVTNNKLSPNLEKLQINCYKSWKSLPELPESLIELKFDTSSKEELDINELFQLRLPIISIKGFKLVNDLNTSIEAIDGLEKFSISANDCDFPLDSIYFENAKSSLRDLSVHFWKQSFPSTNLNFSEFTKLTNISLTGCKIINLSVLELPVSIIRLSINDDYFESVDNTCSLFSNPSRYRNLLHLIIYGIEYISPRVQFPMNLESLEISHYRNRKILSKIINLKRLTFFRTEEKIDDLNIFDDFIMHPNRSPYFKSNLKRLEMHIGQLVDKTVVDGFYDKIEKVFEKKAVNRTYPCRILFQEFDEMELYVDLV